MSTPRGILKSARPQFFSPSDDLDLKIKAMNKLLKAVVDNDIATIDRVLVSNRDLLLVDPEEFGITKITSKTGRKFKVEKPFVMAQKGRLLGATEKFLSHLKELGREGDVPTAFSQWIIPSEAEQKKQAKELRASFECLIGAMKRRDENGINTFLQGFKDIVAPSDTVDIDLYDKAERCLAIASRVYKENFLQLDEKQRNVYATQVIDLLLQQTQLSPELAASFQPKEGSPFYAAHFGSPSLRFTEDDDNSLTSGPSLRAVNFAQKINKLHAGRMKKFAEFGKQIPLKQSKQLRFSEETVDAREDAPVYLATPRPRAASKS